jgi:hypothetical protein
MGHRHAIAFCLTLSVPAGLALFGGCTLRVDAADYITACEAGALRCAGDAVERCKDNGKGFETFYTCHSHEACIEAECRAVGPVPGTADGYYVPDAGPDATAEPEDTAPADVSPPDPVPRSGIVRVKIAESLPGGHLDVGFCAGAATAEVTGLGAVCAGSVFVRFEAGDKALTAQAWVAAPGAETADALFLAPLPIDPADVYEVRIEDLAGSGPVGGEYLVGVSVRGIFGGTADFASIDLPEAQLAVFGLWNLEAGGSDEAAIEAVVSGLTIGTGGTEVINVPEFLQLSTDEGGVLVGGDAATWLSVYLTDAAAGALRMALSAAQRQEMK